MSNCKHCGVYIEDKKDEEWDNYKVCNKCGDVEEEIKVGGNQNE